MAKCAECSDGADHDVMYIHGKCHPNSRTWTFFEKHEDGTLTVTVECGECKTPIITLRTEDELAKRIMA